MGGLVSRWRKKPSTIEVLEQLEKDITGLQKLKRGNLETQKKIIGALVLYSVVLYILSALVFYFYYWPEKWADRLLFCTPLLLFPILVYLVKRFLHWYFVKRIAKNESALEGLRETKKTILEDVMETETYKKAKEILEKFDPERFKKLEAPQTTPNARAPDGQELRQRSGPRPVNPQKAGTPVSPRMPGQPMTTTPRIPRPMGAGQAAPMQMQRNGQQPFMGSPGMMAPPGPPLPRSILPRDRSAAERVIDMLVGDGPQNRYALICKQCYSHNGMALTEEFEYLAFRCCYCYTLNPAKKQRPNAPRLADFSPPRVQAPQTQAVASTSEASKSADVEMISDDESQSQEEEVGQAEQSEKVGQVKGSEEKVDEKTDGEKKED